MTSIPSLATTLATLFTTTADRVAREGGFLQRRRKLSGSVLATTLVFGFLDQPTATLRQLQQTAAQTGVVVSPQAIAQRCTEQAATFLQALLGEALHTLVSGEPVAIPLLQRFAAVEVMDSTTVLLPPELRSVWKGCGGSTAAAAAAVLKVQFRTDVCRGGIEVLDLTAGKASDQKAQSQTAPLPRGALRLADLGYFSVPVFRRLREEDAHFLTRPMPRLTVQVGDAPRGSLGHFLAGRREQCLDLPVVVGGKEQLACRLIAVRVPAVVAEGRRAKERAEAVREGRAPRASVLLLSTWTVVLTSLGPERLTVAEALVLLRLRWQVELVFKRWKSAGLNLEQARTAQPWQVLCRIYAKLIAGVVAHWLSVVTCWEFADKSLHAVLRGVQGWSRLLLVALRHSGRRLVETLRQMRTVLPSTVRLQRRKRRPASFQLLLDPSLQPLN